MFLRLFALVAALLTAAPASAVDIEGVRLDPATRLGDASLQLNGAGVRSRLIIKAYVIGLYLGAPVETPEAAMAAPGPKRIEIVPLMGFSAEQFTEPLVKGMKKNLPPAEFEAMQPRIRAFVDDLTAVKEVRKGSRIALEWLPGRGSRATIDGQEVSRFVEGEDFYRALLAIWVGNKPTQDDLKLQLLAGRTAR